MLQMVSGMSHLAIKGGRQWGMKALEDSGTPKEFSFRNLSLEEYFICISLPVTQMQKLFMEAIRNVSASLNSIIIFNIIC